MGEATKKGISFSVLATDYDGTIAEDGIVAPETIAALESFHNSNRKLILVTGRELPELASVFDRLDLFDMIVAENGALLFNPRTNTEQLLAIPPPKAYVDELSRQGVTPLSQGRVIVATREPFETTVLDIARQMDLSLQIIFNKGAVMILPEEVDKAFGLEAALRELNIHRSEVAGIGDAENDLPFLQFCGVSVAVQNALPDVKSAAMFVTEAANGAGVREFIERSLGSGLFANSQV